MTMPHPMEPDPVQSDPVQPESLRTLDEVFDPPGEEWQRVSTKLITARRLLLGLAFIPVLVLLGWFALATYFPNWVFPVAVVGFVAAGIWAWWLIGRRVRSWGYVETDDELMVTSGILVRRLVVVPYGRLQLVDVTAGPIDRAMGIATVQLHTAAATSDATIPGLEPEIAASLRDRLAARGEQRTAGL
jgi:membrane protein YdbS with pleckstrin-like domain